MKIIAISGDGAGAGKTTAAQKFASEVWSIAGAMRGELSRQYPGYDWYNKSQAYKAGTRIKEYGDGRKSMREVLLEYGQIKCTDAPTYWIEQLIAQIKRSRMPGGNVQVLGIDDVRKICELDMLRTHFPGRVLHLHVANPQAVHEPLFEAEALRAAADYVLDWTKIGGGPPVNQD